MADIDKKYHELLNHINKYGFEYEDPKRKGVIRKQIHSYKIFHDFTKEGFPAITTKKLYWQAVVGELIWFLRGDTNIKYLNDNNIHIWDKDAANYSSNGDCGRIYGAQWRDFRGINISEDQIKRLILNLINQPMATDHIVNSWNAAELNQMALPPCHNYFQVLPRPLTPAESSTYFIPRAGEMKKPPRHGFILSFNMRSVDVFLGLPFNLASYAILAYIIGKFTNMIPLGIEADLHNVHIYKEHEDSVNLQLSRDILKFENCRMSSEITDYIINEDLDNLTSNKLNEIFNKFEIKDFNLVDYDSYPLIKEKMLARDE